MEISATKLLSLIFKPLNEHQPWKNPHYFFLMMSLSSLTVEDLSNFIMRTCFEGGIVFILVFLALLFVLELPAIILECQMGQYVGQSALMIFWNICPAASGIGFIQTFNLFLYLVKNTIITSWLIHYFFAFILYAAPWTNCGHYWSSPKCVETTRWKHCLSMGKIFWDNKCRTSENFCSIFNFTSFNNTFCFDKSKSEPISSKSMLESDYTTPGEEYFKYMATSHLGSGLVDVYSLLNYTLAWICTYFGVFYGIQKSTIQIAHFLFVLNILVNVGYLLVSLLPYGAMNGLDFCLGPKIHKLATMETWYYLLSESISNAALGYGINSFLASYNLFHFNFIKPTIAGHLISTFNKIIFFLLTSCLAGFALRPSISLGFRRLPGNAFQRLLVVKNTPDRFRYAPISQLWATFYTSLFCTTTIVFNFVSLETIVVSICDFYPRVKMHDGRVRICVVFSGWLCGLLFYIDSPLTSINQIFTVVDLDKNFVLLLEICILSLCYGFASEGKYRHMLNLMKMVNWKRRKFFVYLQLGYYIFVPFFILLHLLLTFSIVNLQPKNVWFTIVITLLIFKTPIVLLSCFGYHLWKAKKSKKPWTSIFRPSKDWIPNTKDLSKQQPKRKKNSFFDSSLREKFIFIAEKMGFN